MGNQSCCENGKGRKGKSKLVSEGEVGGEVTARAGGRVRGLVGGPSLEVLLQFDDGTRGQSSGSGSVADPDSGLVLDSNGGSLEV